MKKQSQIIRCFIVIFAMMLLTACRYTTSGNFLNSSEPNSTFSQYEGLQTDSSTQETDDTQLNSSNTAESESPSANSGTAGSRHRGLDTGD